MNPIEKIENLLDQSGTMLDDYSEFERATWIKSWTVNSMFFDRIELGNLLNDLVMISDIEYTVHKYDTAHINISVR